MNCPVYPPHAACGGHGTCDTTKGLCVCEDGWTSRGDFFMSKGVNCNINLTAIKVLWGLTMVFNVLVIREAFLFLKVRMWDTPFKRKYLSDPTFQFPLFYFVGCVIGVGMAILKIVDLEERSIGYDPLATVFFCGMCFFVVSATFIFALVLIRVIIGQTKMMAPENKARVKKYGEKVRYTVLICIASCLVLCNIPLLILAFPKQEYVISSLFYAGQCSSAIFLLVLIYLSLSMIVGEITKHLNNKIPDSKEKGENPMAEVRNKLLKGKQVLISMGPGILLTYLAIIFSEFLYMNSSYIWPLFFLLSQPSLYAYIHSVRLRGPTPTDSYDDSRSKTGQINTSKLEGETSKTPSKITDNGVITDQEEKAMASSKIVAFTPPKDKADNI